MKTVLRSLLLDNLPQKAIALAMAISLFMINREDRTSEFGFPVTVRVNRPANRVLVSPLIEQVKVTVEGKYRTLRDFSPQSVPPLQINLTGFEGQQVSFDPEMFKLPPELKIIRVVPSAMLVRFEEKKKIVVPVEARLDGDPQPGFRVTEVTVDPPTMVVEGANSAVEALRKALTERITLVGRSQSTTLKVKLAPPPAYVNFLDGGRDYSVRITIEEKRGTRVVRNRPVQVRGVPAGAPGFEVSPATISVTMHGPLRLLDALDPDRVVAYVDVSGFKPRRRKSLNSLPVAVETPEGLTSLELKPDRVTLLEKEPPPPPDAAPVVEPPPDAGVP